MSAREQSAWETIRQAELLLDRGRGAEQRRLERVRTADRLRRQAETAPPGRRLALLDTAAVLEGRAGRALLEAAQTSDGSSDVRLVRTP